MARDDREATQASFIQIHCLVEEACVQLQRTEYFAARQVEHAVDSSERQLDRARAKIGGDLTTREELDQHARSDLSAPPPLGPLARLPLFTVFPSRRGERGPRLNRTLQALLGLG